MSYRVTRLLFRIALRVFFRRIRFEGLERIPRRGATLIVANHANALVDPLLLLTRLDRRVTLTAKSTLRRNPLVAAVIRALDAVVFHRSSDVGQGADPSLNAAAIERCRARLERGDALVVFPEGVSHSEPAMRPFKTGAARIALEYVGRSAGPLTVVPVGLHFERKEAFRSEVTVLVGEPFDAAGWAADGPARSRRELTAELERRVRELTANFEARRDSALFTHAAEISLHWWRVALFALRELELTLAGLPLALWGALNHLLPYHAVRLAVRRLSKDRDHFASNAMFLGVVVFPLCYALQITAAALLLPGFWAVLYAVSLPYSGAVTLLYRDRLRRARGRTRAFLKFARCPEKQRRLSAEARAIADSILALAAELDSGLVLDFRDRAATDARVAGGKGASLARLTQAGFPVPEGAIVSGAAYGRFIAGVPELPELAAALEPADPETLRRQCAALRTRLVAQPLPAALEAELRERLAPVVAAGPVSVRSSATLEDLAGAAFAGQHDTYLDVRGMDAVLDAVRRCFASLWEDRAVRYRLERGFPRNADMAVVVQAMVRSEVSGVLFSIHPVTGDLDQVVVNAAWGLGETVVSGDGGIDQYVLDKQTGALLDAAIGDKAHALVAGDFASSVNGSSLESEPGARFTLRNGALSAGRATSLESEPGPRFTSEPASPGSTRRIEVPADRRLAPCLGERQLAELLDLARRLERQHAFPQDTEWAWADGRLHLLQARPVTHFPPRWTRAESAERFPNPVTPLSWDFTTRGFHESLAHSLELMGLPPFQGAWFERLDGYIYGNETAIRLFTSDAQLSFGSLDQLAALAPALGRRYRWVQELPVTWARELDRYLLGLGRLEVADLNSMSDLELWRHVLAVDALGREYFLPNIAISITQAQLHRLLFRVLALAAGPARSPGLYDALTAFCETKTSLVNADLHRLYRIARSDDRLRILLLHTSRREVWAAGRLGEFPLFDRLFRRLLEDHGHREVEFDPYHPTWIGQPWVVLEQIRLMLLQGDVAEPAARETELRARQQEAEREFLALLPDGLKNFSAELVRLTRAYTALDDLEHYQTTRLNLPFRRALLALGERLARRGVLELADDIFFLRRDTLDALVAGHVDRAHARTEAARHRTEHERQRAAAPAFVHGEERVTETPEGLRGLPGSGGIAEGVVCHVLGAEDFARFRPGSVLVARTTNPAWTPLFYSACAVITESGGPLSHGAVTAREVGVPAVMAVRAALSALPDGARVRVDGTRGTVIVLAA